MSASVRFRCASCYPGAARCTSSWCTSGALHLSAPQVHFILVYLRCTSGAFQVHLRCTSGVLHATQVPPGAPHLSAPQVHLMCASSAPQRASCAPQLHLGALQVCFKCASVPPGAPHQGALQVHSPSGSAVGVPSKPPTPVQNRTTWKKTGVGGKKPPTLV